MNSTKKTAKWVGTFYITATVAYSFAMVLLDPITGSPDYLTQVSQNANQVIMGTFLVLVDAIAVAGIGICMYKILKKHHKALALGFLSARVIEGTIFMMTVIPTLALLTLSHEFVKTGAQDTSYYQALGQILLSAGDWIFLIGYGLVFGIAALILNFLLYKSKLVPRWLSGWGFVSAVFVLANYFLQSFGISLFEFLDFSIAIQEMVFAGWLIVKGFNPSAIASDSVK
ncbi:DUF4386 domain-containing protein [Patescibacteria group bacterium]